MAGEPVRLVPIASGLNKQTNPLLLGLGETPDGLNTDYDEGTVRASGGGIKMGNKAAPKPGVLCKPSADGRLPVLYDKSAPVRGHVVVPYKEEQDIGGDFVVADHSSDTDPKSQRIFAARRGQSFGMKVSFKLPSDERLFSAPTNPANATHYISSSDLRTALGADLALDEMTIVAQKGGDGMTPMSWALGIVNTGALLDTDVGGGNNLLGVATSLYQSRESNYMLCFLWLDAPGYGAWRPSGMRYILTDGTVSEAQDGTGTGDHCTLAYRAFVAPLFVEPGRTYHVELGFTIDSGSAGTGNTPTTAWGEDAVIQIHAKTDDGAVEEFEYDEATPAAATLYRYKGPTDSLEYFGKYGVRYSGREEMHLGLGYRCAPWTAGGHLYAGIDSAPLENFGFQVSDHSEVDVSTYDDLDQPDNPPGAGNTKTVLYQLRVAHATTETNLEVNFAGMVDFGTGLAAEWGLETSVWDGIGNHGRHPWGIHDRSWQGLDPDVAGGVNTEALRGYRVVFQRDAAGVTTTQAAGFLLSIATMENASAYGGATYAYRFTPETGTGFVDNAAADFGPGVGYTYNDNFYVTVRAFRWNQRPTVISDFRIYSSPRSFVDKKAEWSLWHETSLEDTAEPGAADLQGWWPLDDGEGGACQDLVAGNDAVFSPFALPVVEAGLEGTKQVFLSGEGERIKLDFGQNPVLKELLRETLKDGRAGFAIQMTFRPTGAVYGHQRQIQGPPDGGVGTTDFLWEAKFAPNLISWSAAGTDPVSPDVGEDYFAHGQHVQLQPMLEFGHRLHLETRLADPANAFASSEPFFYALPFEVKSAIDGDEEGLGLFVPAAQQVGSAAFGYAWYQLANQNFNRYHRDADWAGRTITVQIGVEPSATDELVNVYIAWTPSESLISTIQPPDAEFAFFESETMHRRDLERSIVTIGGGLESFERSWMEMGPKMFVDSVRIFGCTAPGDLPSAAGAAVATGTGKLRGGHTYPARELLEEDILRPVGQSSAAVSVTNRSVTVDAAGNADFPLGRPEVDLRNLLGTFLRIQDEDLVVPQEESLQKTYPRAYFIEAVAAQALTLRTPYQGSSKSGVAADSFRLIGYTAFGDFIETKPLPLGKGKPLTYGTTLVGDAVDTSRYWLNVAPGGVDFVVTVLSPVAVGRATDMHPEWVRGLVAPRENPILGVASLEDKLYAAAQGSLFEVDDRHRLLGPTTTLDRSVDFRALRDPGSGFALPLEGDRCVMSGAATLRLPAAGRQNIWDSWFQIDEYFPFQTIAWCGRQDTDPAKDAGATAHGITWWIRLHNGHPEFCLGSTGAQTGGGAPAQGLFIAKGNARVPLGVRVHVRFMLLRTGDNYQLPVLFINGNPIPVTAHVVENTLTLPDWTIAANDITPTSDYDLVLGCARDSQVLVTAPNSVDTLLPNRQQGWMHSLAGELSLFGLTTQLEDAVFDDAVPFDPRAVDYTQTGLTALSLILNGDGHGVGHALEDSAQSKVGPLHAHPFISLWHEMGRSGERVSFANYNREIYAANGGRVVVLEDGVARPAGLLKPQSIPEFALERDPLFELNSFDATGDVDNDAIEQLDSTLPATTDLVYHYRVPGTSFIRQIGDPNLDWSTDQFFAFSCLIRMNSVDGRIPLYSRRNSLNSGGIFVECRDGFVYVGWWDTSLKKEVFVRTSKPVLEPGVDTYIYVRKWYPRKGAVTSTEVYWGGNAVADESNWLNSQFDFDISTDVGNPGLCRDMLVVRQVPKKDLTSPDNYADWTGFDLKASIAYPGGAWNNWFTNGSSSRACVSFVLADSDHTARLSSGESYDVTGPVLIDVATFDGADTDSVDIAGTNQTFVLDHLGMLLQFSRAVSPATASANFDGAVFRIVEILSVTKVRVLNMDGTSPTFVAGDFPAGNHVIVAPDVALVKSDRFDDSLRPDGSTYPTELFGSQLQEQPLNGITPFDGVTYGWKLGVFTGLADRDGNLLLEADVFEDASAKVGLDIVSGSEVGCDDFGDTTVPAGVDDLPFAGVSLGQLQVTGANSLSCVDVRNHWTVAGVGPPAGDPASSQPNSDEEITADAARSTSANDWNFSGIVPASGTRRVRVRFLDPKNGAKSEIGDELLVHAVVEDDESPSRNLRLVLTALPVSSDPQKTLLQVFITIVDGAEFFLVGEVDSRSDAFSLNLDDVLISSIDEVLDVTEGAPPFARVVGVAQSSMWYGDISVDGARQPDGVAYSKAFNPEIVPPLNVGSVDTGDRVGIVGIREFAGEAVLFKRNSIFRASILTDSSLSTRQVSKQDGAVSEQSIQDFEGRLYFLTDRGPSVLFSLEQEPVFIGKRIQRYFRDEVDKSYLPLIAAGINRLRDQYVFVSKGRNTHAIQDRFSVEFDHPFDGDAVINAVIAGHRFSQYSSPQLTALGSVVPKEGGPHTLVGGTLEGFMVWLDRSDTRSMMMGFDADVWGALTLEHATNSIFTGVYDNLFEGPRGAALRWLDASGVEQFGYIIQAYLDQNSDLRILIQGDGAQVAPEPPDLATVSVGALLARWSTREIDFGMPHLQKRAYWIDVSRVPKASGQLVLDVFRDLASVPETTQPTLDLTKAYSSEEIGRIVQEARSVRFLFKTVTPAVDIDFELVDLTVRADIEDNR